MPFLEEDEFADKYQRNNKQTGVKNLRCFPRCSPEGHQSTGFCGRPVRLVTEDGANVAFAEFTQLSSRHRFSVGATVRLNELKEVQSLLMARPPISPGDTETDRLAESFDDQIHALLERSQGENNNNMLVEFRVRRGWHYEWVSNRHTCMNLHCLRAYMFIYIGGNMLQCVKVVDSPSFQVYSRRRSVKTLQDRSAAGAPRASGDSQDSNDSSENIEDSEDEDSEEKLDDAVGLNADQSKLVHSASRLRPQHSSASTVASQMSIVSGYAPAPAGPYTMQLGNIRMSPEQVDVVLLAALFEVLEVGDSNQIRLVAEVSPIVFSRAIESLSPSRYDQRTVELLLSLTRSLPITAQRRVVCEDLAGLVGRSPSLISFLRQFLTDSLNVGDTLARFATFAQAAFAEYANAARIPVETLVGLFRQQHVNPSPAIFRPLFPYAATSGQGRF